MMMRAELDLPSAVKFAARMAATATTMLSPIHQKKIAIIMVSHSRYKSPPLPRS